MIQVDTVNDMYMLGSGLPTPRRDGKHVTEIVNCALDFISSVRSLQFSLDHTRDEIIPQNLERLKHMVQLRIG